MKKDLEQQIYFEDMEIGDKVVSVGRTITEADIVSFAGLTGDYNTLHTDAEFAKGSIAGQRLAHGMLPLTYSSGLFTRTSYNQAMMAQMAALTEINWKFKSRFSLGIRSTWSRRSSKRQTPGRRAIWGRSPSCAPSSTSGARSSSRVSSSS